MNPYHTRPGVEIQQALAAQKRKTTITSFVIAILVLVVVGLILSFVWLQSFQNMTPVLVGYQANTSNEEEIKQQEQTNQVKRKPSAPSSAVTKVIAANTPSDLAIPVPDIVSDVPSMDFGTGDDFGDGWGSGGFGDGSGAGGGTTFFGQKSAANWIVYVIDYSISMKGKREDLMRKELRKSLNEISNDTKYQMVFFAGPAWIAGHDIDWTKKSAEVEDDEGKVFKWVSPGNPYNWRPKGDRQTPKWLTANRNQLQKSKNAVSSQDLVWGTSWEDPLEMALSMSPPPQAIYFMTDGAAGGRGNRIAQNIGNRAKELGTKIHCVAMMEPEAHAAMEKLTSITDGQFTIVTERGKVEKVR